MNRTSVGALVGFLLIALGGLLLLQTFELISFGVGVLFGLVFGAGGVAFLSVFARDRKQWWSLMAGFPLAGLGLMMILSDLFPRFPGGLAGAIFLGSVSLSFWVTFLLRRDQWWAVIPGGAVLTLALVSAASELLGGAAGGGIFFLGLAATFGVLYWTPTAQGRMTWAWIPAVALAAMGMIVMIGAGEFSGYLWAVVLILGGLVMLARSLGRPKSGA